MAKVERVPLGNGSASAWSVVLMVSTKRDSAQCVVDQGAGRVLLVQDVLRGVAACLGHGDHGASPAVVGDAVVGDVAAVPALVAPVGSSTAQGAFDQTEPVSAAGPQLLDLRAHGDGLLHLGQLPRR